MGETSPRLSGGDRYAAVWTQLQEGVRAAERRPSPGPAGVVFAICQPRTPSGGGCRSRAGRVRTTWGSGPTPHIGHSAVQIILQTAHLLGKKINKNIHPQGLVKCRGDTRCCPAAPTVLQSASSVFHCRTHGLIHMMVSFYFLNG